MTRPGEADREGWQAVPLGRAPLRMALILAASFGTPVAVLLLLGTFGPGNATALRASGPVP